MGKGNRCILCKPLPSIRFNKIEIFKQFTENNACLSFGTVRGQHPLSNKRILNEGKQTAINIVAVKGRYTVLFS